VLGQRAMKLDPITVVRAFLCGQSASNFDKSSVSTVHQYYQGLRPVMLDMMEAKLFGPAGSERNLLTQMGPNTQFNKTMVTLAESCMIFSLAEYRVDLDFSEESLKDVDRLLEIFSRIPAPQHQKHARPRRAHCVSPRRSGRLQGLTRSHAGR
jgi:hypothetical protein